ncbi:hypothetical protein E2C01_048554 [Portunus trituberculatus]|uniref:Ig-like domain-containing protein n=1 Tax=Portunus trituberculatus TaxID=210409 RepID=A0A5B7G455_PORTR|nr:hypothetical protein [Portunus trituberculatus]
MYSGGTHIIGPISPLKRIFDVTTQNLGIMVTCSIDARKGPTALTAHWSGLGERAHFDLTSRPPGLVLQGVREGDAGLYRCRVDFAASPTRNLAVTLSVVVPPESVVIEGREGLEVSGVIGPYHLGEALTLTCHASKGENRSSGVWVNRCGELRPW